VAYPAVEDAARSARLHAPTGPIARSSLEDRASLLDPRVAPIGADADVRARVAGQVQLICQTALDAIVLVDDHRRFVRVNRSATRLYRTPAAKLLEMRLDDFSPREHEGILTDLWAKFQREGTQWGHYELLRGDGTRTMVEYRACCDFDEVTHLIAIREIAGRAGLEGALWARRARMGLSPRELQVLQLVAEGKSAPEIAGVLFVSAGTVKTHLKNIYGKLGSRDRASAVAEALRRGLIE
jgi:DNA-binding CsgD family transcriptional regulator